MNTSIVLDMYRDLLLSITRGKHLDHIINAKPIYLLSIFSLIEKGSLKDNRIQYDDFLKGEYASCYESLSADKMTPLFKPFVFMAAEPFYHLRWKTERERLPNDSNSKFVRENIEYAYLDNALWDLLQDKETRDYLKETVINYYLN